jgi:hypothetical protein
MELLPALTAALEDAKQRLNKALATRAALDEKISAIQAEHDGLELAIAHQRAPDRPPVESNGWDRMPRTQAILKMMSIVQKPVAPSDLVKHLAGVGRTDDGTEIGAALAYLHQGKKVRSLGRGQWVLNPAQKKVPEEAPQGGDAS